MDNEELLVAIQGMMEDVKRHTGVLVEDLRREVKAIAEGHSILDNKIDNVQQELTGVKNDVSGLKQDMTIVKNYVIAVDDKLNKHDVILKRIK
ncbi:MAG: hypothetical protein GX783_10125 [Clostridiales bacterium]|nr:hypothetical protein [Clostridiales bacterium]